MSRKRGQKQPAFTEEQRVVLQLMEQEVSEDTAARINAAIRKAYAHAHEEASADPDTTLAKQTFSSLLPNLINRYLRAALFPKTSGVRIRVALNPTKTNAFIYMNFGRLKVAPFKTRTPTTKPSPKAYLRLLQQRERIELTDPPEEVRPMSEDVIGALQFGHTFEFGVPAEPEFIRLSAYEQDGRRFGAYIDMMERAAGRMARVLEEMVITPLIAPVSPALPAASEPKLVTTRRRRGEPAAQDVPSTTEEQKTS
ncbi:hypothetical protein [Deinococcus multiflagellatus]|uniref:Uncharacterized protein n=1 Tax=Deinococcus multiflagellatus TaxID=1656887 RepID=A0ABW1ZRG4_9DEIO|nr:hypothetical protein [Deinococcus multiflagellatus]MBZ9715541.1 hypothetical protein [Deinococcus multiflagellatus]